MPFNLIHYGIRLGLLFYGANWKALFLGAGFPTSADMDTKMVYQGYI
jgi:hypothetical protein